jgi:hypothetical protein
VYPQPKSGTLVTAAPGGLPKKKPSSSEKWCEWMEKLARFRDNTERVFQPIRPMQPFTVAGPQPKFEPEVIVGEPCKRYLRQVTYSPLPNPYTGSCELPVHECGRDEPKEEEDPRKLRQRIIPNTLKQMVDTYLAGYPKYLVAHRMSLEKLSTIPGGKYLEIFEVDADLLESERHGIDSDGSAIGRDGTARYGRATSCIFRAIQAYDEIPGSNRDCKVSDIDRAKGENAADPYGWIPLTDNDLVGFLTKARATGLFLRIKYHERSKITSGQEDVNKHSQNYQYYYVRVVPRYLIAERNSMEQREEMQRMIEELFAPMPAGMELENIGEDAMTGYQTDNSEIGADGPAEKPLASVPNKTTRPPENESHPGKLGEGIREEKPPLQESPQPHVRRNDNDHDYDPLFAVEDSVVGSFGAFGPPPINGTGDKSSQSQTRHFGIWQVFGGPQGFESCYLGLEVEKDVMRVWGFPGNAWDIKDLAPAGQQNLRLGTGSVHQYDVDNMTPVFKGFEYESRSVSNFTDPDPQFEHVEQSPTKTIPVSEDVMAMKEDLRCTIESVKPDKIIFTISEEGNRPKNFLDLAEYFGRYRLARLEPDETHAHDRAGIATNVKKLWQLCKLS